MEDGILITGLLLWPLLPRVRPEGSGLELLLDQSHFRDAMLFLRNIRGTVLSRDSGGGFRKPEDNECYLLSGKGKMPSWV